MLENDWLLRKDSLLLRDALCEFLEEYYGKIRFLEEKTIGKVRADMIAVLPDGLLGIEIKSHSDTYTRLADQVKGYNKFCDLCYLCVGSTHIHAEEHIPKEWGIILMTVRDGVRFEITREPQKRKRDALKNQLSLLWRDELSAICVSEKMPKYTSKSKKAVCEILISRVPAERLKIHLCDALFERDYTKYSEE